MAKRKFRDSEGGTDTFSREEIQGRLEDMERELNTAIGELAAFGSYLFRRYPLVAEEFIMTGRIDSEEYMRLSNRIRFLQAIIRSIKRELHECDKQAVELYLNDPRGNA